MTTFASQLLLFALLALAGIWAVRHISQPIDSTSPHYTVDDLVWRDHKPTDDETAWENEMRVDR